VNDSQRRTRMMKTWLTSALAIGAMTATAAAGHDGEATHGWKLDRPVVSSYFPMKGDPNTKVVIRGENFAPGTTVVWGGSAITGAHVSANEITFSIPKDAKSGTIALRATGRPDLAVGGFEVAHFDPADVKKAESGRQLTAENTWKDRQKTIAKDRAARDAELVKQEHELETSRAQRRTQQMAEVRTKWQSFVLTDPDIQAEMTLHSQRVAELERIDRLATARADGKLVVRAQVAITKENDRHEQRMATLQNALKK
jgi:hypothetical protein